MSWRARIRYESPYGAGSQTWVCEHPRGHQSRKWAVRCGTAELRRITRGHNVAPVTLEVEEVS